MVEENRTDLWDKEFKSNLACEELSASPTEKQMSLQVESADVIRLIAQFLHENHFYESLKCLEKESELSLNFLASPETLKDDILAGKWDSVLKMTSQMKLPVDLEMDIHEQVVLELIELRQLSAARQLLRGTDPMHLLQDNCPERYGKLEQLVSASVYSHHEAYSPNSSKEERRAAIAKALMKQITGVRPGRLLALISDALKWQHQKGVLTRAPEPQGDSYCVSTRNGFDLLQGSITTQGASNSEFDYAPNQHYARIKLQKSSHAEYVSFSPNGEYLATGSVDGFIEIWDHKTGKLRKDLQFQKEQKMMVMDASVLCVSFSPDSLRLAAGSKSGKIHLWTVPSGQIWKKIAAAHSEGVTALDFSQNGTQLISGSFDGLVKLHGMKSGKTIKEFRGHTSFVNACVFSRDGEHIYSGSSDGTVKIWDVKSTDCLHTVFPTDLSRDSHLSRGISHLIPLKRGGDQLLVSNKTDTLYIISTKGKVLRSFCIAESKHDDKNEIVSCCASPHGQLVLAVDIRNYFYCYKVETGDLLTKSETGLKGDPIGIAHHPQISTIAIYGDDGPVQLWKS